MIVHHQFLHFDLGSQSDVTDLAIETSVEEVKESFYVDPNFPHNHSMSPFLENTYTIIRI